MTKPILNALSAAALVLFHSYGAIVARQEPR